MSHLISLESARALGGGAGIEDKGQEKERQNTPAKSKYQSQSQRTISNTAHRTPSVRVTISQVCVCVHACMRK